MHIPTKISAIKKVNNYPQKYEYCHDCKGSGKSFYVNKFSDGYDGKLEKCLRCNGKGYTEIQK